MKTNSTIKQFLKTSGIFMVGTVLSKAISILLLPLYTSKIEPNDLGYYDVSLTYVTIITSVFFFDVWVAILRYMYDVQSNDDKFTVIKSGLKIFCFSSSLYLLLGVVLMLFSEIASIGWILAYGLVNNIAQLFTFCARGFQKNKAFAISGVISTLTNVILNLLLILKFEMGYESLYIAGIGGFLAQIIFISVTTDVFKAIRLGKGEKTIAVSMFKYCLPLSLNSVAFWLLSSLNRIILNTIYGNSANGFYAVGYKFSVIIALATSCFTYAWQDLSFSVANKEEGNGSFYAKSCSIYILALSGFALFALPAIKIAFPILVDDAYATAEFTIPLFIINAIVAAVSTFIGNIFYAIKRTKSIFVSMLISAIVNVVIGYPFIMRFGINGANLAVIISFVVNIIIRCVILKRLIGFELEKKSAVGLLFLTIATLCYTFFNAYVNVAVAFLCVWLFRNQIKLIIGRIKK